MIKNYFKIAFRNLWRNKIFSLINIVGLSLAMASILSLMLLINQYMSRDEFHEHKDRLYYLKTFASDGLSYQQTTFPLLYEIEATCPEVEAITHWQEWDNPWLSSGEHEIQEKTIYVDPDFLQLFSFKLVEGEPENAMQEKQSILISKRVKTQLFGDKPALGQTVVVADSIPRIVTGVVEIPSNSYLQGDVFLPVQFLRNYAQGFEEIADWYNTFAEGYLMIRDGADPVLLNERIAGIIEQHYAEQMKNISVKAIPFTQLKTELGETVHKIIVGALAAAIFILLIVVVNLVNLNMATLFTRTREVAVRRIVGSSRTNIIMQFCIENGLIMTISFVLGLALFQLILLTLINDIVGTSLGELNLNQEYTVVILLSGIAVAIVVVAAGIPSIRLNSLKLTEAIKGKITGGANTGGVRNFFITTQFVLGITFLCMAFILNRQVQYMKNAALGFNTEDVVVSDLHLGFMDPELANNRFETILQSLRVNPYVAGVSTSQNIPTSLRNNANGYTDIESNTEVHLQHLGIDAGFVEAYQIPLIAGRNFNDRLEATEGDKVLLNETAAKAFGWADPVGKKLREKGSEQVVTVIGVLKDYHYKSLDRPIEPLLHWYGGKSELGYNGYLSVRIDSRHKQQVIAKLEELFKQIPSKKTFSHQLMDERVENQYVLIDGILKATNYVAILILLIACMGLLGLSAMFAQQRTKEIGIRKVLGASVAKIVLLLSKDYMKLVVIAVFVASPIAWWVMNNWLEDFAYRINMTGWMIALAGLVAVAIALFTVGWQALRAAEANPVESLREE